MTDQGMSDRSDGVECPSCGSMCTAASDFCSGCGYLFERAGEVRCVHHPSVKAEAVCVICQDPQCSTCATKVNKKTLCAEHATVRLEQDYALVYSSSDINDADLARAVLDSLGFEVVTRDFQPIGYVWDGAGDSSFSRSALHKQAKVYVPIPDYLRAVEELNEWSEGRDAESEM